MKSKKGKMILFTVAIGSLALYSFVATTYSNRNEVMVCEQIEEKVVIEDEVIIANEIVEEVEIEVEQKLISLGNFKLTAYCSCSSCCGKYAYNRPKDEYGNEIVYGSIGEKLVAGKSIAVDPRVIPYGTEVIIDGNTYIAQDTGGAIKGNKIDVYHDSHKAALNFGVRTAEVFMLAK